MFDGGSILVFCCSITFVFVSTPAHQTDTVMSSVFQGMNPLYIVLQAHQNGIYVSGQVSLKLKDWAQA